MSLPRLRPGHLLAVVVALATCFKCALLLAHGLDLELGYPYMFPDSHDWIANGLHYAGAPVGCSLRPPALPLLIAALDALGLLAWLPLVTQAALVLLVAALHRLLARRLDPRAAALTSLLLFASAFYQDFAYYVMADLFAGLLTLVSLDHFLAARRRPRRYLLAAFYLGLGGCFQYAPLILLPPVYLLVLVLRRRAHLRERTLYVAALPGLALAGSWFIYRWARFGDPFHSDVLHLELLAPRLDGVAFYLFNCASLLSLPVLGLLVAGLVLLRRRRDAAALPMLLLLGTNFIFWVLLYGWNDRRFLIYWTAPLFYLVGLAVEALIRRRDSGGRLTRLAVLAALVVAVVYSQLGHRSPLSADRLALTPRHDLATGSVVDARGGVRLDLGRLALRGRRPGADLFTLASPLRRLREANDDPHRRQLARELTAARDWLDRHGGTSLHLLTVEDAAQAHVSRLRYSNALRRRVITTRRLDRAPTGGLVLIQGAPPPAARCAPRVTGELVSLCQRPVVMR